MHFKQASCLVIPLLIYLLCQLIRVYDNDTTVSSQCFTNSSIAIRSVFIMRLSSSVSIKYFPSVQQYIGFMISMFFTFYRLQSKERTVHQSLQLLQSTQAQFQQFKDICDNLKSHFSTTVNDIDNNFQLLKNYFNSKLTELYAEKANLQQALFSAKKNYKVAELSLKEETMKREEELRKREEIIENVNLEQSSMYGNNFLTYKINGTNIYMCRMSSV